jgi:hypothetical protein
MIDKTKKYIALLAASLNIVSSLFFIYALDNRHIMDENPSISVAYPMGTWLFMLSLALWVIFVVMVAFKKRKKV